MLVHSELYSLEAIASEGLSPAAVRAYVDIGFVEPMEHDLGVNLIGAALVVEVLERYGR
ncbi:MAG: dafA [Meiothermus silvanus]|nr:dafA [Allomeiothermus silvanus]